MWLIEESVCREKGELGNPLYFLWSFLKTVLKNDVFKKKKKSLREKKNSSALGIMSDEPNQYIFTALHLIFMHRQH